MKVAVVYHASFERLGCIEDWFVERGHTYIEFHLYKDSQLPETEKFHFLVIMGGPMSIHDEALYPWLLAEKAMISEWIAKGKAVLGICLGAQLIAAVLECPVYREKNKEIGWFPIYMNPDKLLSAVFPDLPEKITVFHWHGETFDPPVGSICLASSDITRCQGFLYDKHVLALQFHSEVKPENISLMINHAGDELLAEPYIQDAEGLSAGLVNMPENKRLMKIFLDYFDKLIKPET